jgi:hypothetical protein
LIKLAAFQAGGPPSEHLTPETSKKAIGNIDNLLSISRN